MGKVAIGDCLCHSDHKVVEFHIIGDRRKTASKPSTLDVGGAEFRLLKELVSKVPWESAFEGIWVHKSWSLFKSHLLRAQKQIISKCWESRKWGRGLAWMIRDLTPELKQKRKVYGHWKQGQAPWEDYRDAVHQCREKIRAAKV